MGREARPNDARLNLLIVEPERDDDLQVHLQRKNCSVVRATSGSAGLQELQRRTFDGVILARALPDVDGIELCLKIRHSFSLPIVLLTAPDKPIERILGLEAGADDCVARPPLPGEVLVRLHARLRSRRRCSPAHDTVHFGRLEIDYAAMQIRVGGELRRLTARQFQILEILSSSAGHVLSRDHIMNRLEGRDVSADDRSVDVAVSFIRQAIEDDPKRPRRVLTVRGAGYLFSVKQD